MADETFLTIAEAKTQFISEGKKNGSFIATVSHTGDLKSGTKGNKDYTYKKFTLKDDSDTVEITAWGNDVNRLKMGCNYEFVKPYWNTYQDNPQVSFNQYGSVTEISGPLERISTQQTTMETPEPPATGHPTESKRWQDIHDECWAFAYQSALKVYPEGNKDTHILAQVFYKKTMDYRIHREGFSR